MARFVSKHRGYRIVIRPTIDRESAFQTGRDPQKGMVARFRPQGLSPWEKEASIEHFGGNLRGVAHDENPIRRFSVYDTETQAILNKWDASFRNEVEERLRTADGYGVDYIEIVQPRAPEPWPNYDKLAAQGRRTNEMVAEKIAETVRDLGYSVEHVLLYERENRNRPEVVAALEALTAEPVADETVISA